MASIEYVVRAVDGASTTFAKIAAQADALNAQMDDLSKKNATPSVELQDRLFQIKMTGVQARLDDLKKRVAEASVGVTDKDAVAKLAAMNVRLDMIGKRVANPKIDLTGAGRAEAQLLALDASLGHVTKSLEKTGPAASGAGTGLAAMATPMAGLVTAGVALAPVLVTAGIGLAGFGIGAAGTIAPLMKAAQATGGLEANLAKLDPEQQAAAMSLLGLQANYRKFEAALKPTVLADFSKSVGLAGNLLRDLQPVSIATGKALGGLLDRVDAEFASGTWQNFFAFMERNAGPDIQLLGDNFIHLMDVLPPLLEALQPLAVTLLRDTDATLKMVGAVATWINTAEKWQASAESFNTKAQKSSGVLGAVAQAAKNAAGQIVPGVFGVNSLRDAVEKAGQSSQKNAPKIAATAAALDPVKVAAQQVAAAVTALNTDWNILVGNFASKDQVLVNTALSFDTLKTSVQKTGANSLASRGDFDSYIQTIGSGLDALTKAGAGNRELNGYLQQQINRLQKLGPLTSTQQQELAGLRKYQDALTTSTASLTAKQLAAAHAATSALIPAIQDSGGDAVTARKDMDAYGVSILNTGTKSTQSRTARQHLITDLESSGISARDARVLVDAFIKRILAIPANANTNVHATGSASGQLTFAEQIMGQRADGSLEFHAAGGLLRGGVPGRDSILLMGMPGEVIVPTPLVQAGAVDHLRGRLPGFAAGGLVGAANTVIGGIPWESRQEAAFLAGGIRQTVALAASEMSKLASAAATAALAGAAAGMAGPGGGAPAANAALARQLFPQWGSGPNWAAWNYVAMRESGWNQFARNPSSGAYGIPQALPPGKMGAAANPPQSNPAAQIRWMASYMSSVYGGPQGAAAHERAFSWYDRGGYLPPGVSLAVNGTGQPEQVLAPGDTKAMIALLRQLITEVRALAPRTGSAVTAGVNGGARGAGRAALYNTRGR